MISDLLRYPDDSDIERIYAKSLAATIDNLPDYSKMIKGTKKIREPSDLSNTA